MGIWGCFQVLELKGPRMSEYHLPTEFCDPGVVLEIEGR